MTKPSVEPRTHLAIDRSLSGDIVELEDGRAITRLTATEVMAVDDRGLVHGSFVFGLADYAAMLAVNHPNVVLGAAEVRFKGPVVVGEVMTATATRGEPQGRKLVISVRAAVEDREVMAGTMTAFVLESHVLDRAG